jgi:hypothetical protein
VADEKRPAWLAAQGFRVLRFWNHEALANTDAVLAAIEQALHTPTPPLPHRGGGDSKEASSVMLPLRCAVEGLRRATVSLAGEGIRAMPPLP